MAEIDDLHFVVRNDEHQYSIWPAGREVPAGWEPVGDAAARAECLNRVDELWTDMRPASLRAVMDRSAR
ncbi:MbtH protein [Lentzea xinjiangensis]|uniref:MbtH protein n=1 Tax=Lentzea xinjiangensis TaxID=402600 RepID=A0A1H9KR33_9PSEU|nr:MbtH family NRPS accessory protein [Lentzea xinjiangensis]SER01548.1 MbtH protein [Lentzea xinjiangensis]